MRNFLVNVNGTKYEITVEEINGAAVQTAAPAAPAAAPAPAAPKAAPAPAAPAPAAAPASAGGETVNAPMPGTILSVSVRTGDTVKKGQVLMILEAMKMENEILAPADGKATGVYVSAGNTVDTGAALCSLA